MTILQVEPLQTSYSAVRGVRNYTSQFRAISDTVYEDPITVAEHPDLPKYRFRYQWPQITPVKFDNWSFVTDWSIVPEKWEEHRLFWLCTYEYTSERDAQTNLEYADPIAEPEQWSGGFIMASRAYDKDPDDKYFRNSSWEPIGPLDGDDPFDTLVAQVNTATVDLSDRGGIINKRNNAPYLGFNTGVLKCTGWEFRQMFYPDVNNPSTLLSFISHRIELKVDFGLLQNGSTPRVHQIEIPDKGLYKKRNSPAGTLWSQNFERIKDDSGEDVLEPVPLDGNGNELPDFSTAQVMRPHQLYDVADFTKLPLSGTLPPQLVP